MIRLDSQIDYLAAHLLRFFVQQNGQPLRNVANQHASSVFGNPNEVVAYLVGGMSRSSDHFAILVHQFYLAKLTACQHCADSPSPLKRGRGIGAVLWGRINFVRYWRHWL